MRAPVADRPWGRGRIGRDRELRLFLLASLEESWDGVRFTHGAQRLIHAAAVERFGERRACRQCDLSGYMQHLTTRLSRERVQARLTRAGASLSIEARALALQLVGERIEAGAPAIDVDAIRTELEARLRSVVAKGGAQ